MIYLYLFSCIGLIALSFFCLADSPWSSPARLLSVVTLFHGLAIKPIFVALSIPSYEFIDDFILSPLTRSDYWQGSLALQGCYWLFVLAMFFTTHFLKNLQITRSINKTIYFETGASIALLIIGLLGFFYFTLENPSLLMGANKNVLASDSLDAYSGNGILRLITSVLSILPFLMLINIGNKYKIKLSIAIFLSSAISWILFGIVSDQRGLIIFSMLVWLVAYNMFVDKLRLKYLLIVLFLAASIVTVKTAFRLSNDDSRVIESVNDIVGNYIGRNFIENGKTLIVIDAIPNSLQFSYGESYLDSILILLPRSLFPSKLTVNLDTIIGNSIFGCNSFGACAVPPGLIAESYLNFGPIWVILSVLMCGFLTAWLDWKSSHSSYFFKVFYVSNLVFFGIAALGSGIASFITQTLTCLLVLCPVFYIPKRTG